jgi:hypothetical protein
MPSIRSVDPETTLDVVSRLMIEVTRLHPSIERCGVFIPDDAVREVNIFRDVVEIDLKT